MPETLHSLILSAAPPFETLQKREASKTAEPHHTRPACVCVLAQGLLEVDLLDLFHLTRSSSILDLSWF